MPAVPAHEASVYCEEMLALGRHVSGSDTHDHTAQRGKQKCCTWLRLPFFAAPAWVLGLVFGRGTLRAAAVDFHGHAGSSLGAIHGTVVISSGGATSGPAHRRGIVRREGVESAAAVPMSPAAGFSAANGEVGMAAAPPDAMGFVAGASDVFHTRITEDGTPGAPVAADPEMGTHHASISRVSTINGGADSKQWIEATELEADCRGPVSMVPMTFSSSFDAVGVTDFSTREVVWMLKHREMVTPQIADSLVDLEGKYPDRFRQVASEWIASVNRSCSNPELCLGIAARILSKDDSLCPQGRLLTQVMKQLGPTWQRLALGVELAAQRPRLLPGDGVLAPDQLVLQRFGRGLLMVPPALESVRNATLLEEARGHLANLVNAVVDPGAEFAGLTRNFLLATTRQAQSAGALGNLISLIRLLEEQRGYATADMLVRDATVVDYYEPRVAALEAEAEAVTSQALVSKIDAFLEQVGRAAADHKHSLPGDTGALPAYWMGRLEKARRQLEDRISGRPQARPTVLIWTCSFGGGHRAATNALLDYLPDHYIVVSDPTKDPEYYEGDTVGDWIRQHITPKWDETYVFNELILKHRHYNLENTMETIQAWRGWLLGDGTRFASPCISPKCDYQSKKFMRRALLRAAPDFIITVYHMDLLPITELCDELGDLPIMHIATDIDAKMWEVWGTRPEYPHLRVGLPFDVDEAWRTIHPLDQNQTFVAGYTVRRAFLMPLRTQADLTTARLQRRVPKDAMVVLMMSGSEGQSVTWPVRLANSETWTDGLMHIFIIVGSNAEFGSVLERSLQHVERVDGHLILRGTNRLVTLEVAKNPGNTEPGSLYFVSQDELAILMDIADLLVTKAGGSTTAEAAYRGLPILFDATAGMLKWEAFTAEVFERQRRGRRLNDNAELEGAMRDVVALGKNRSLVLNHQTGALVNSTEQVRSMMLEMRMRADAARRGPQSLTPFPGEEKQP